MKNKDLIIQKQKELIEVLSDTLSMSYEEWEGQSVKVTTIQSELSALESPDIDDAEISDDTVMISAIKYARSNKDAKLVFPFMDAIKWYKNELKQRMK